MNSLNKKFHITLIAAAAIAMVLLYTTFSIPLIGAATGVTFGITVRLFFAHKKNDFAGTKKLDWILMMLASAIAVVLMLTQAYNIQALLLIFVAVRALLMYFTIYSKENVA